MIKICIKSKKYDMQYALIDNEDFDIINKHNWYLHTRKNKDNSIIYYARAYVKDGKNKNKKILMHRLILGIDTNYKIDHINHNGLDNRKENLRVCTTKQNNHNRRKFKFEYTTSQYKGVSWHKNQKMWCSQIVVDSKVLNLGYFDNEIDAAKQYDYHALKFYGEFACLNFPEFDYSQYILPLRRKDKSSSKHYFVVYNQPSQKWRVLITTKEKNIHVGMFLTEDEAVKARNEFILNNNLIDKFKYLNT